MIVPSEIILVVGMAAAGFIALGVVFGIWISRPSNHNAVVEDSARPEVPSASGKRQPLGREGTDGTMPFHSDLETLERGRPALPDGCIETRVLYLHNDPKGFRALARELRRYCIDLTEVKDADTAYMACFSERPKMVLVDANLPGEDYRRAVKRIEEHPLAAKIVTIVVAEHESHEALHERKTLDGTACLSKPIEVEELLTELTRHTIICDLTPDCINQARRYEDKPRAEQHAANTAVQEDPPAAGGPKESMSTDSSLARGGEESQRPRVLCIDDDPHVSQAIMMRLRPLGVDVIRAFDGMQGFWTGLDTRPDVIITDMRMPDGEGNYIFSRFQAHPLTKDVPVIVLTGETNPAVRRTMLALGAAAYFTKPWSFDDLRQELERHIDLRPEKAESLVTVAT